MDSNDKQESYTAEEAEMSTRTYTAREKALRDRFIKEYLVDYDALGAATRVGYPRSIAKEYAVKFMEEPYVVSEIARIEGAPPESEDKDALKRRIMAGLFREANYRGPGSSQAARVAALAKLAQLHEMEPANKSKFEHTGPNGEPLTAGQFVIPGVMTPEQWAEAAAQQQADLVSGKVKQAEQVAPPSVD